MRGARLARAAADAASTPEKPRFVAGAMGPTNRTASISPDVNDPSKRNVEFDELADDYGKAGLALMRGGVDIILIETIFDTLNAKAAIFGLQKLFDEVGYSVPLMLSVTITDQSGRTTFRSDNRRLLECGSPCKTYCCWGKLCSRARPDAPLCE